MSAAPIVDFLIIGAMRAGTTTLYQDLARQPGAFFPAGKEPGNLARGSVTSSEGRSEYSMLFSRARAGQLKGDASTIYSKRPLSEGTAERALEIAGPSLRIVYMVREPIARIISHYKNAFSKGETTASFENEVTTVPDYVDYSRYAWQLEPWLEAFGPANIKVVSSDDYSTRRGPTFGGVVSFLGLEGPVREPDPSKRYNQSSRSRTIPRPLRRLEETRLFREAIRPRISPRIRSAVRDAILPKVPEPIVDCGPEIAGYLVSRLEEDLRLQPAAFGTAEPFWTVQTLLSRYR